MTNTSFLSCRIVTDKHFYKRAMLLIIPVLLQSCINQGVNMMDTIMVGRLGEVAISASSLANQFYLIFKATPHKRHNPRYTIGSE